MRLFDTHAHIGLIHEDPIEQLIIAQEARQAGVEGIISICNNLYDFFALHENLKKAPNVYFAVGVSPSEVQNPGLDWEGQINKGAKLERVVAIGETGLDYFKKFGNKDTQVELFIKQLDLARRLNFPVIIHNREAGADILEILKQRLPPKGGVLHCYSEDWNFAKKALELNNLYLSFAGNITYRTARTLHDVAKLMPVERMVIESESPFMVSAEHRGKRNKPSYLASTLNFIAELRGVDPNELSETLFANSKRLFSII